MASASLPTTAQKNIETITQVEQRLLGSHTRIERVGERIAKFFGSLGFIAAHAVAIPVWIALNVGIVPGVGAFDPYPFPFLGLLVGVEFIFLTAFVLMNQTLQSRRQEQWGHLNLQVCLLTEQEVTKNMQMLQMVCEHLGLEKARADPESKDLVQAMTVTALVDEIEKARDGGKGK